MRRDPRTIIAAHRLDPERKELYVEGQTDRLFLSWLSGADRHKNARIVEAKFVDLALATGGERGRLIEFARQVADTDARILVFADADTDRLRNVSLPPNVVLTDGRDVEGYVLRHECIEKVTRLGLTTDRIDASRLLADLISASRLCGALRYASDLDGLNLPFQRVPIDRYARLKDGMLELNSRAFVQTLAQKAGLSIRRVDEILQRSDELAERLGEIGDLVHGKDAMRLADVALKAEGVRPDETRRMLFCSFERDWARTLPSLQIVLKFLETP